MTDSWTLAVIIASVREERLGPSIARWFVDHVRTADGSATPIDLIDLAALDLPDDLGGAGDTQDLIERIDRADGVVVVTPEYNRGYPGPLKTAIDTVVSPWRAKPVGFVAYGGVSGGLRAVEQLRPVFAELHAVTVQAVVALPQAWDSVDAAGVVHAPRAGAAATKMLHQLTWWARVLRHARKSTPYAG